MSPLEFRWLFVFLVTLCSAPVTIARPVQDDSAHEKFEILSTLPPVSDDDYDKMLSDMPVSDPIDVVDPGDNTQLPDDSAKSNAAAIMNRESHTSSPNVEDRDKLLRIKSIESQILSYMGWTTRTPAPIAVAKTQSNVSVLIPSPQQADAIRAMYDNVNTYPDAYQSDTLTEKTQSFYPICELPKNTNEEIWNSKESMNLMFNISVPRASNGMSVNVSTARLRLYKQFVSCYSQSSNETDDTPQTSCQQTFLEDNVKRTVNSTLSSLSSAENLSSSMDDKQIRVSVYVRSLKKKKVKRRLLDSRMMPYYGEKWTEWNIHRAVKNWRNPVRNFALSIEVEDEYGNFLPVNRFFKPMNCTGDAQITTSKPIPGFLMEAVHFKMPVNGNEAANYMSAAQALSLNVYRYPIADVTSVEAPEPDEVMYRQAKDMFMRSLTDNMQQQATSAQADQTSSDEHHSHQHRIRHGSGNRHKINSTDVELAFAKLTRDGREFRQQQQRQVVAAAAASHMTVAAASENTSSSSSPLIITSTAINTEMLD